MFNDVIVAVNSPATFASIAPQVAAPVFDAEIHFLTFAGVNFTIVNTFDAFLTSASVLSMIVSGMIST